MCKTLQKQQKGNLWCTWFNDMFKMSTRDYVHLMSTFGVVLIIIIVHWSSH